MYVYDEHDRQIARERVAQFRDQTERALAGELSEEEFLPLRLQNGLYVQRLAPMLRICVPYGMLRSEQLRRLARITRDYDKGYAHVTTRTNIQLNWPNLEDVPDILAELAEVEMHANQTSGNCIRNTTTDPFSGAHLDEIADPRPYCEIIRQWSTFHPEFAFLPRKFKIAVNASEHTDRAAIRVHDIGLQMVRNSAGELGFRVHVGGGLGRTPMVGPVIREFLPELDLLTYLESIVRVYNRYGRRDNKFKARIKILVKALSPEGFAEKVEAEWQQVKDSPTRLTPDVVSHFQQYFTEPDYQVLENATDTLASLRFDNRQFDQWLTHNVASHKKPGYAIVTLTLKKTGTPPGDVTDYQLEQIADLADEFSFGEARATHEQNIVLADVRQDQLFELWQRLVPLGFATANLNTLTDIICCPGGDFCALANAKSIPVAQAIQDRFDDLDYLYDLGPIDLNISGCMNACGHHHVGNIGVLGVDKRGEEFYQVSLGGSSHHDASIGKILGPSFAQEEMPEVISRLINVYVDHRTEEETFLDTYRRVGLAPFKEKVYA
ncbi:sulfite reductase [Marinobacter fuscus]|uniref:Sulfite reductase n=1 Tax=Marinobacter fuscus TaxID=2109942 RepID=A0A2T1K3V8_9GAMM|nr:nitrite/sulfite reductase [Marinobacter fuscus]PSF04760.1 sulfite reductase [Marinobacter fuscus]